ncbi:hypothetical protein BGZ73_000062 [Actinomortierella ambigua]|nr:hypothetical protein BGZ73_000062 [Actinomortierella ambigua]
MFMTHLVLSDSENSNDGDDGNYICARHYSQNIPVLLADMEQKISQSKKASFARTTAKTPTSYDISNSEDDNVYGSTIDTTNTNETFYDWDGNKTMAFMSKLTSALADGDMSLLPLDRTMNPHDLPNCTFLADATYLDDSSKGDQQGESAETEVKNRHPTATSRNLITLSCKKSRIDLVNGHRRSPPFTVLSTVIVNCFHTIVSRYRLML